MSETTPILHTALIWHPVNIFFSEIEGTLTYLESSSLYNDMKTAASNLFNGQGRDVYQAVLDLHSDKRQHRFVDYVESDRKVC